MTYRGCPFIKFSNKLILYGLNLQQAQENPPNGGLQEQRGFAILKMEPCFVKWNLSIENDNWI